MAYKGKVMEILEILPGEKTHISMSMSVFGCAYLKIHVESRQAALLLTRKNFQHKIFAPTFF
jgi:hypothetical protein